MAQKHIEIMSDDLYEIMKDINEESGNEKKNDIKNKKDRENNKNEEKKDNTTQIKSIESKLELTDSELERLRQLLSALDNKEFEIVRKRPVLVKHNYFNIIGLTFDYSFNTDEYIDIYFRKEDIEKVFDERILNDNYNIDEVIDYFFNDDDINQANLEKAIVLSVNRNEFMKVKRNV